MSALGMPTDFLKRVTLTEQLYNLTQKGRIIMSITEIKIRRAFAEGRLKAVVSVTLDNCIAIHELKIIQGNDRLFVAMPSRMDDNGVFRDIIHPITFSTREAIENAVLNAYYRYNEVNSLMRSNEISA